MSDRPHVAYVGDGGNYHVAKWLPALVRAGIRVTLISYDEPDTPLPGVAFSKLPGRVLPRPSYLDYLRSSRFLRRVLEAGQCDVLMGSYATHYGFLAARTGFTPFIMQTWTGDLSVYPFKWPKRLWFGPVVRYGLRRADLITTDGKALLEIGRGLYPEIASRMVATRWGIDTSSVDQGRPDPDLDPFFVVTAPRGLQHWYQPELVLESMQALLGDRDDVFVIVLTLAHERSANVQQMLDQLAAHPRARVVDRFLDQKEMADIWCNTDVVVSIPHADGVSESILEAAYAGATPVLSDIPSNRSLVDDGMCAKVLSDDTVSGLVRTINLILEKASDTTSDTMSASATTSGTHNREWVAANATVDGTADQLAELIRALAVEKRGDRTR